MSHNKITVNGRAPDATGAISEGLGDLSDVDTSGVGAGKALLYNSTSSTWEIGDNPITNTSVFIGEGASQAYSGSGASGVANGDVVEFYAASPHAGIDGATITSASNWVSSVTLPVGTYKITANVALTFSSAGSVEYSIYSGGSIINGAGYCAQDDLDCHNPASAIVKVSSGTSAIDVRLTSTGTNINTVTNQGNRQAELGYLVIERIA